MPGLISELPSTPGPGNLGPEAHGPTRVCCRKQLLGAFSSPNRALDGVEAGRLLQPQLGNSLPSLPLQPRAALTSSSSSSD